jgi:hypothetical protein
MNYLLKERKEVESDSVSVAVFDDVDVSKSLQ